jgi:hypothetical protein
MGPSLRAGYVVPLIISTMSHSDSLDTRVVFGVRLMPRPASAVDRSSVGYRRASPVHPLPVSTCHVPYAGAIPTASPDPQSDYCLRPNLPGSARSVPYGFPLSTRQTSRDAAACGLAPLSRLDAPLRRPDFAHRREPATGPAGGYPDRTCTGWPDDASLWARQISWKLSVTLRSPDLG